MRPKSQTKYVFQNLLCVLAGVLSAAVVWTVLSPDWWITRLITAAFCIFVFMLVSGGVKYEVFEH